MQIVSYLRVSTDSQGESGLGLESQRDYIAQAAKNNGWEIVAEFIDTASGSIAPTERPECLKAINAAKELGATLVTAKLDRLSRDVEHIAGLMKRVSFKVATMPEAESFQLHIYAALAQQEREFIGQRTKDALHSLKVRADAGDAASIQKVANRDAGRAVGHSRGVVAVAQAAKKTKANSFAASLEKNVKMAMFDGAKTYQQLADSLNAQGAKTARDCAFTATAAQRLVQRIGVKFP
jgi:DNA invertase Pin-like site-specific DNA recombinase